MCGRAHLSSDVEKLIEVFSIPAAHPPPNFAASWNVAPTDPLPVVRYNDKTGERSLDVLRWGLVPFWAKDIKVGFANINAKAEGIDTRPAFREAFQRRRCLVPIDTTVPNALCGAIHDRMPVILKPGTWPIWLGEEPADPPQLKELLAPYPPEEMIAWPVGARVGNVKNNDPGLIEPLAAAG
ncbi:MAG TPA: SOS response-associated peptidase [Stellaceae bacterium]|nr:SOS response-associated peptidase [Stellaceae bacterium]